MHYAVAIAVLASLANIGLANPTPQGDSGDTSRCGISLLIGGGNPTCHVNTSNQPGGHGQSADLPLGGDCLPTADGSFSTTDPTFGDMSFQINGNVCNKDQSGGYCYPVLTYDGEEYDMVVDPRCTNGGRHPYWGNHGWWWRCQVPCPAGA